MFPHLLLLHDADHMDYASKLVYMSIMKLQVTHGLFICTLEACGTHSGF